MEPLVPCIQYLGVLWELTLLGEPLLVIANTPQLCSQAVLALTSLIRPFHYCNELRPYFTIHDSDFKSLTAPFSSHSSTNSSSRRPGGENDRQTGLIIGVTNPFFCKTLNKVSFFFSVFDVALLTNFLRFLIFYVLETGPKNLLAKSSQLRKSRRLIQNQDSIQIIKV